MRDKSLNRSVGTTAWGYVAGYHAISTEALCGGYWERREFRGPGLCTGISGNPGSSAGVSLGPSWGSRVRWVGETSV